MKSGFSADRAAEAELMAAALYYESRHSGLGREFMDEFERGVARIIASPETWPKVTARSRRYLLRRFPYAIIYQLRNAGVAMIAMAHAKREWRYWRDREA